MARRSFIAAAMAALVLQGGESARAQDTAPDSAIEAAFLYKFGSFVEWPAGAFPSPATPVNVCIVGHDPFGETLDRMVQGQSIGGRPVLLTRLSTVSPAAGCHIAFLGGSPAQPAVMAAQVLAAAPVLTVADDAAPDARVAIRFATVANRVRFRIDQRLAAQAGLTISSKLLNLAVEVAR